MENRVWCELMKLHTVDKKKPTKELVGRKRQTAQKKVKKHHPKAARGLGDALSARKNDLIVGRDEAIGLSFLQIFLFENRWYPAGRRVRSDVLAHLVLLCKILHVHLRLAHGGLCRSSKGRKVCNNGGGGGSKELINSKIPHYPLYIASHGRNVG
jgi:hypothetical protein